MTRASAARAWAPVLAVLLLVAFIGMINLNADGLWYDEWWSFYNAGAAPFSDPLSPAQIWDRVAAGDPWQTPGYPLILSAWGNLTGWSELSGRALSLFAGMVAIGLTFRFARSLTADPLAASAAAGLLGGSSLFLYFTHELRVYTLYLALSTAFLYSYWWIAACADSRQPLTRPYARTAAAQAAAFTAFEKAQRAANRKRIAMLAALVITGAVLLYLHPFGLTVYGAVGIWHLVRLLRRFGARDERFVREWLRGWFIVLIALGLPLLIFAPWTHVLLNATALTRSAERASASAAQLARIAAHTLYAFSSTVIPMFALFVLFSFRKRATGFLWLIVLLLAVITLAAYFFTRLSEIRYGMAVLPFLAMLGGLGVAELHRRRVPAVALLTLWCAPALLLSRDVNLGKVIQDFYPQPIREMAQTLQPYLSADAAVIDYLGQGLRSEQQQTVLVYYLERPQVPVLEMETSRTLDVFTQRFEAALGGADHLWLMNSPLFPGQEWALVQYLLHERDYALCRTLAADDTMEIYAYGRVNTNGTTLQFGQDVSAQLIGSAERTDAGLLVWVGLNSSVPSDTYSVGLHLLDANGALVAQEDRGLSTQGAGCLLFVLPVTTLAPGAYHADLMVYDWRTGARLPTVSADGTPGDSLPLVTWEQPSL
ncbi:MAG: hypothetical protein U0670_02320 [Anaerolineae bacterium]